MKGSVAGRLDVSIILLNAKRRAGVRHLIWLEKFLLKKWEIMPNRAPGVS